MSRAFVWCAMVAFCMVFLYGLVRLTEALPLLGFGVSVLIIYTLIVIAREARRL